MFLSIDLSAQWIRLVQLEHKGDALHLRGFAQVPTPPGSYKNGVPVGMEALSGAIKEAVAGNHFTAKKAVLVASSPAIGYQEMTLPTVKRGELLTLLAQETRSASQKEMVADYLPLETQMGETGGQTRLWAVVAPVLLVESYRELLVRSGLKPMALDTPANVSARLYRRMGGTSTLLVAGVRREELCLTLMQGRERYGRTVPVQRGNGAPESQFILSARAAEPAQEEGSAQVGRSLVEQVSKLVQFQTLRNREEPLRQVMLCSDLAQDPGLLPLLGEHLGLQAAPAALPDWLVGAPADFPYWAYCYAVGAGLRGRGSDGQELDLFARLQAQKKSTGRENSREKRGLALLLAALLTLSAGWLLLGWREMRLAQEERAQLEEYLSQGERGEAYQQLSQMMGAQQDLESYNRQVEAHIHALEQNSRLGSREFEQLDAQRPAEVKVTGYQYGDGVLTVHCTSTNPDAPAQYAAALAASGDFAGVRYTGFDSQYTGRAREYAFTICCQLWPAQEKEGA